MVYRWEGLTKNSAKQPEVGWSNSPVDPTKDIGKRPEKTPRGEEASKSGAHCQILKEYMSQEAKRPEANIKKIHSRNEFELCYLRHQYLRKAKTNPTVDEMKPFLPIAAHMARNTYYMYKNLFQMVGFEVDDVINIANVHLISFLGLFSLDKMPSRYDDFVRIYRNTNRPDPTQEQIQNKDKADCTLFMKQRMEDVVRVCRQKARNIKGLPTEEYFFYFGKRKPPAVLRDLVDDCERYGYRKLDQAVYKSIRKKIRVNDSPVFRFNDMYYVAVPVEQKHLQITDFIGAGMDPSDNMHNMNPESIFFAIEDDVSFEQKKKEFSSRTKVYRARVIRKFIEQNRRNPDYRDELKAARKMLKSLT